MKVGELPRGKFRFYIYSRDHRPPHIHALSPDGEALVEIATGRVLGVNGISEKDVRIVVRWVLKRSTELLDLWEVTHEEG